MKRWFTWYSVDGIFFDQASRDTSRASPNKAAHLAFYTSRYQNVQKKKHGALVVLNFGCFPESIDYAKIGPIILCVHENEFAPPSPQPSFLQWTFNPALGGKIYALRGLGLQYRWHKTQSGGCSSQSQ